MSSTQMAAAAAAQAQAQGATPTAGARRSGLFGMRRSHPAIEDDGESSDDSSDNETTWDHRASARGKGAWAGVARMSEAFGVLRQRLGGQAPTPRRTALRSQADEEEDDEAMTNAGASLPPGASRGFEVVRAPPTRMGAGVAAPKTPPPQLSHNEANSRPDDIGTGTVNSTILANQQVHRQSLRGRGPLGMLGADLQRAPSSAGHSDDGGEERFWLPPPTTTSTTNQNEDTLDSLGLHTSQRSGGEGLLHREG